MDFYQIEEGQRLERNRFGIYEPPERALRQEPDQNTLILVPGLAFDDKGGRIGFGSGYYDRYLERHAKANMTTVGICFDFQLLQEPVPSDDTDQKMQYVLTPKGMYAVKEEIWL